MDEKVLMAALAGLLHDVGKFAQRAGESPRAGFSKDDTGSHGYHALHSQQFIADYVPTHLRKGLSGVLYHHRQDLREKDIDIVRQADHLAAGEHRTGSDQHASPKDARLIPILTNVTLAEKSHAGWAHTLTKLDVSEKSIYPTQAESGDYAALWKEMTGEINAWKQKQGQGWETQNGEDYFITLLAVLQKYLWCIPSATPWQESEKDKSRRAWPDVSLYDHCRLTSAIAACLVYEESLPDEKAEAPVALLVRGDFSGIQNFIYRISRPDADTKHIAKRLRGRSFYVQLLSEVIVDWFLRELGLPPVCAVFVGGGRFDVLAPLSAEKQLRELQQRLETWLLQEFQGEIGVLLAVEKAASSDFSDTRKISERLNQQLDGLKRKKWQNHLAKENFFEPAGEQWHVCKVCQLTPLNESDVCAQCLQQEDIGTHLPHARYLAFCSQGEADWDREKVIQFPRNPFGMQVAIICRDDDLGKILASKCRVALYSINETTGFIQPGVASSFRFLANTAPKALEKLHFPDEQAVDKGEVLHFEAIAGLSKGAKRLGILKADVDRLGLVMSEGLVEEDTKAKDQLLRPTLSRVASLSRTLDMFFAGVLNRICRDVFNDWQQQERQKEKDKQNPYVNKTDGLFYVMYSGGDDLFIVGPWDQVLMLALRIQQEFRAFSGQNPNLTLSAGYVQVKPRYPVQKFANLVDDAEKLAKKERNQFAAFGTAMFWAEADAKKAGQHEASFEWLLEQANTWTESIEKKDLPSGLIYDLGGLFRQHRMKDGKLCPTWTPQLYYTLARRLKPEMREKHQENIFKIITSRKTLVPVSITSLSIRERSE